MIIDTMFIKTYLSFIVKLKKTSVEFFELLQVFKLMTVPVQALLITRTDGIANITNYDHFIWYLGAFSFNCCSQLIDCYRFCATNLIFDVSP